MSKDIPRPPRGLMDAQDRLMSTIENLHKAEWSTSRHGYVTRDGKFISTEEFADAKENYGRLRGLR